MPNANGASAADAGALITRILDRGMLAGIALKPSTSFEAVLPFVDRLSHVLVMTVEPGFGGQSFMAAMMPKVRRRGQLATAFLFSRS